MIYHTHTWHTIRLVGYYNYVKNLTPYTAHYHISDGSDLAGEGLEIGERNNKFYKAM